MERISSYDFYAFSSENCNEYILNQYYNWNIVSEPAR